jgi:hypothetical protein
MPQQIKVVKLFVAVVFLLSGGLACPAAGKENHRFSVQDDIEVTQFGDVYFWIRGDVVASPSGDKVLVHTVRASLEDGAIHDELRVYTTAQLEEFVNRSGTAQHVEPIWKIEESRADVGGDGPLISNLRWLDDETGVAFLLQTDNRHRTLCLAKLDASVVTELSSAQDNVLAFEIRNESHYVFAIASRETRERIIHALDGPFQVGTGRSFWDLMSPEREANYIERGDLWAAIGGRPVPVMDTSTGKPISLYEAGTQNLSLSPDGKRLVTVLPLSNVPKQWEALYPPPYPDDAFRVRAGSQDLDAISGLSYVSQYVLVAIDSGAVTPLTNAPAAAGAGWSEAGPAQANWSSDGSTVLLPGTFIPATSGSDRTPCVVAVQIKTGASECVKQLKRDLANGFESGYERTDEVVFADGRSDQVLLKSSNHTRGDNSVRRYVRTSDGVWRLEEQNPEAGSKSSLQVRVMATFKDPPILLGTDIRTGKSRTVFDPNPQLKHIVVGASDLWDWEDRAGRKWQGILFKPVDFQPGVKYPLVIQNHGFSVDRYTPSGGFPSAFAAEELASAGIMVLQVRDCAGRATTAEGPCNVEGYEAAVEKLARDGLIDPSRVGIIGFSRTVYYVLEALTSSQLHFQAASITDGINVGYVDYLHSIGPSDAYRKEAEAMIGSQPIGSGLLDWIKRAPLFNMDKLTTPLRVVATRSGSLNEMWEPYALLEAMHKPVDLIVLNTDEHVITNPKVRLAAQGGNIDWFRFWLQGYEDPDPAKRDEYARWRKLRELNSPR